MCVRGNNLVQREVSLLSAKLNVEQNRPRLFTYLPADLFLYMTSSPVTITRTFYYSSGMFNLEGNKVTVLSICLQIWWSLSFNPVIHHNLVLMALGMAFTRQCSTALKATKSHLDIIFFLVFLNFSHFLEWNLVCSPRLHLTDERYSKIVISWNNITI